MTWQEFKAAVDALGVKDTDEMWFIDWSGGDSPSRFDDDADHKGIGVAIT